MRSRLHPWYIGFRGPLILEEQFEWPEIAFLLYNYSRNRLKNFPGPFLGYFLSYEPIHTWNWGSGSQINIHFDGISDRKFLTQGLISINLISHCVISNKIVEVHSFEPQKPSDIQKTYAAFKLLTYNLFGNIIMACYIMTWKNYWHGKIWQNFGDPFHFFVKC